MEKCQNKGQESDATKDVGTDSSTDHELDSKSMNCDTNKKDEEEDVTTEKVNVSNVNAKMNEAYVNMFWKSSYHGLMTASMCHNGMGTLDFARVLVEINARKDFKNVIEMHKEKTHEEEQMEKIRVEEQNKMKKFADNEAGMQDRRKNFSNM
uniref:Uncharacterized protein n=1 Tax=Tanacetum cinerariifolium TaxID=118510 RepID=A0A6L2J5M3_TANCI|nr:hypothetical protein [Tanacetum cinerariifolium]